MHQSQFLNIIALHTLSVILYGLSTLNVMGLNLRLESQYERQQALISDQRITILEAQIQAQIQIVS